MMSFVFKNKRPAPRWLFGFVMFFMLQLSVSVSAQGAAGPWHKYINSHTAGVVSKDSAVKVEFVKNIVPEKRVGEAAPIFSFSPAIAGRAVWTGRDHATFTPDDPLAVNQYKVTLKNLKKLIPKSKRFKPFSFAFEVVNQAFELEVGGLSSTAGRDGRENRYISGTILTADAANNAEVEETLKAVQNGADLKIHWTHDDAKKLHKFTIKGIKRFEKKTEALVYLNGIHLGVKERRTVKIPIPPAGIFKVEQVKAVQGKQNYILIRFSDILDDKQNLRGLIHSPRREYKLSVEGNIVKAHLDRPAKRALNVIVEPGIKNALGQRLKTGFAHTVNFRKTPPQVRFAGKGVILPRNRQTLIPFESVGLNSIQATAFLVYEKNIGRFLQVNKLGGDREMKRVGRFLWRKTIPLKSDAKNIGKWTKYYLDAKTLFQNHPNGLFRLTLSFNRENSAYPCSESEHLTPATKEAPYKNYNELYSTQKSLWDNYQPTNFRNGWRHRKNPCRDAYYNTRFNAISSVSRNFIASNIGIIAKQGEDRTLHLASANIIDGKPLPQTNVKIYNFQTRLIAQAQTDSQGLARIKLEETPFYLVAQKEKQKGYLKLNSGSVLPTSHFDVGGEKVSKGLKGHIYGERGVWRPGDSIYLTFVLEDKQNLLPDAHPVEMRLYTPRGRLFQSAVKTKSVMNFYSFHMKTETASPTGAWKAVVLIGGMKFEKTLKVETVVPNRLKVELDFGRKVLKYSKRPIKGSVFSQWLHGAPAKRLRVDVALSFSPLRAKFDRFGDFVFEDPARSFSGQSKKIFQGQLNAKGRAYFAKKIRHWGKPAGMLKANFATRVFEGTGAFSKDYFSIPYHPYENYVGLKIPKGDAARGMLLTDTPHQVDIAALDANGKPVSLNKVKVSLYKINWKWWWDKSGESLARYAESSHTRAVASGTIKVKRGLGKWTFQVKYPSWGRYLIRACDMKGKHCAGKVFYIDWPGWAGEKKEEKGIGASRLNISSDKTKYKVGETAFVRLPLSYQGRALVSLENGSRVLRQYWKKLSGRQTRLKIPITREMSPNIYVAVALIQPHQGKKNDRPIRLYGVLPLMVEDPDTKLTPKLEAPDSLLPNSETTVKISEKTGRAMAYTIAMVDEGLLGLTRFQTPDLKKQFYKKESLGVRTWDVYDEVIGAYGGKLERILALGGSGFESQKQEKEKRRFPPVAKFFGPFELDAGDSKEHQIKIPQYIGAVRLMVVAGNTKAYGSADKSVPVKQPLTLLAAMPRVLSVDEELKLPVTIFAMDKNIREVLVSIEPDDFFEAPSKLSKTVRFKSPGDKIAFFHLKSRSKTGIANIKFKAQHGKWKAAQEINLEIRNPNPKTARYQKGVVPAGENFETIIAPHGVEGTRKMTLEVSSIPPVNLERHLNYLIRYPHGCVEQVTSAAFPQLYLSSLTELTLAEKEDAERNIKAAIKRLQGFQTDNGSFSYWPGRSSVNEWATTYAGHFLVEAASLGFNVPSSTLKKWKNYQYKAASLWKRGGSDSDLVQSYRLYALALAGRPNLSAMNRLRESSDLGNIALWRLAAAYGVIGQVEALEETMDKADLEVEEYQKDGNTFGSALRDKAIILESLLSLEREEDAETLAEEIAAALSQDQWRSSQTTAYCLLSLAKNYGAKDSDFSFMFTRVLGDEKLKSFRSAKGLIRQAFKDYPKSETKLVIHNPNSFPIYVGASLEGIPKAGEERASSEGLKIEAEYLSSKGDKIDVGQLPQGFDFVAAIKVVNPSKRDYKNLVLSYVAPSGWEIHNSRLNEDSPARRDFDYQDIRDDRIYFYFDLKAQADKVFRIPLNASYLGEYYLPAISAEAMYDATKNARTKGRRVEVLEN